MKDKKFKVKCENSGSEIFVDAGVSLLELLKSEKIESDYPIIAAYVNHKTVDLHYQIYENKSVRFLDTSHFEGAKVYQRTFRFILYKAVCDIFSGCELAIFGTLGHNSYFEIESVEGNEHNTALLKERIVSIIESDYPILFDIIHYEEAAALYEQNKMYDKSRLLASSPSLYVKVNQLENVFGYFYGTLAPSTSYVSIFDITPLGKGFRLTLADSKKPSNISQLRNNSKIIDIFKAQHKLLDTLEIEDIGALNSKINSGNSKELIKIGEACQERKFAELADKIYSRCCDRVKLILISGPSSSGKTTFSNRLTIELRLLGLKPIILSMDDYFINRADTPLNEKGERDFERPDVIDIELFNSHLSLLLQGEEVEIPRYNFLKGEREWRGSRVKLDQKNIIICEGIHALNPIMSSSVDNSQKFKLYIAPLTSIALDNLSCIDTTDIRLIRRIVRDSAYRGHSAQQTIKRWGSVRRGEENYILPYQKDADELFDTFLFFEISVLKQFVLPLLSTVSDLHEEYSQAMRLTSLLAHIQTVEHKNIPPTSILREFIGGSSFEY
ncbi:MAG: nucleoside kinase [Rikenellaceae bacterium]